MERFYPGKSEKTKEVRFIDTKKSDVLLLKEEKKYGAYQKIGEMR